MHCRVADIAGQKQLFMYQNIKYRKDMKSTAQANMLCESPWKVWQFNLKSQPPKGSLKERFLSEYPGRQEKEHEII